MNYVNDRFQELMGLEMNQKALEVMKKDVDAFMPGFSDSPEKLSRRTAFGLPSIATGLL